MNASQLTTNFIEKCHEIYTLYSLTSMGLVLEIDKLKGLPRNPNNPNPTLFIGNAAPSEGRYQARVSMSDLIDKGGKDGELIDSLGKLFIVHFFTLWNDEYRASIAKSLGIKSDELKCDFFGELRIIRNSIIHNNSILLEKDIKKLKIFSNSFTDGYFRIDSNLMAHIMDELNKAQFYYPDHS